MSWCCQRWMSVKVGYLVSTTLLHYKNLMLKRRLFPNGYWVLFRSE